MVPIATLAASGRAARRAGMYLLADSVPCGVRCFSCSSIKLTLPKKIAGQPEQLQDRLNPESRNSKRLHFLFLFLSSTHHFHRHDVNLTLVSINVSPDADVMTLMTFECFWVLDSPALLIFVSGERFPIIAHGAADAHQLGLGRRHLLVCLRTARILSPGIHASKSHNSESHNENFSHRLLLR